MLRYRLLRLLRRLAAVFFLLAVTACFLDFTGLILRGFGWTVKIQLMPAALALSVAAAVILAVTLVFGRVYCSVVCPLGILQDIAIFMRRTVGRLIPGRRGPAAPGGPRPLPAGSCAFRLPSFSFRAGSSGSTFCGWSRTECTGG